MDSLFSFIVVLGVLIFIHELGHFLFAKWAGVRVLKFSLGFGPKLFAKQWGETEYLVCALPLGGYVKMFGEQQGEEIGADAKQYSYFHKPVLSRFMIVFAGPLFNFLLAYLLYTGIYWGQGIPDPKATTQIDQVVAEKPAAQAGVLSGDQILAINGLPVKKWATVVSQVAASKGDALTLELSRGEETLEIVVTPEVGDDKNLFNEVVGHRYMLGITAVREMNYRSVGFLEAAGAGLQQTWFLTEMILTTVAKLFERVVPVSSLGGPIMIAEQAGKQFEAGWLSLLAFMAFLSINLGVLNLLPVPVLDGGHLVLLTLEAIRRRPLNDRMVEVSQMVGMALLGTLMIVVFYNDIVRFVGRWGSGS